MSDTENENPGETGETRLLRLTPKRAPFRRAGIAFPNLAPVVIDCAKEELTGDQVVMLCEEPMIDVDASADGGETWRRFEPPEELASRPSRRKRK